MAIDHGTGAVSRQACRVFGNHPKSLVETRHEVMQMCGALYFDVVVACELVPDLVL